MKKLFLIFAFFAAPIAFADSPLVLEGAPAKFDYMGTDFTRARVLAAHKGAKTLEILDAKTKSTLKPIPVGHDQGIAISSKGNKYFLGNETEHSVSVVDAVTLLKTDEVKLSGPVDAITLDDANDRLYAAEDNGNQLWVINSKENKLVGTIKIPGVPEFLEFDFKTNHVYLNIKDKNLIARINPITNKVDGLWPTAPVTSPHGLAIDKQRSWLYSAGSNGKMVAIDLQTGKVISSADISPGVDQIVYDSTKNVIYGACRGFISVTKVMDSKLLADKPIPSPKGAHTLAIDPLSHQIWVSFADDLHSYLQEIAVQ